MNVIVVYLFAVVRRIEHDSLLLLKTADNLIHDGIVIKQGVIVISQPLALFGIEFRTIIVVASPAHFRFRTTGAVVHVLSFQMEDDEVVVGILGFQPIIVTQQSLVEITQFRISRVKHGL